MKLLLDTGVVGQICHPRKHQDVRHWFASAIGEHDLLLSEVADDELRRELIRIRATRRAAKNIELGLAELRKISG